MFQVALGMMVYNELPWLELHFKDVFNNFPGAVVVDSYSTDGTTEFLESLGVRVIQREFHDNWSEHFNHVINQAEDDGYNGIIRLDPDESMHASDIVAAQSLLKTYKLLCFSRYNFWGDRMHYCPQLFPDWQARAWQLGLGIRLEGKRHEGVNFGNFNLTENYSDLLESHDVVRAPHLRIYHYGDIVDRTLKYMNYSRIDQGLEPLKELPEGQPPAWRFNIPYIGTQPYNLSHIRLRAPF